MLIDKDGSTELMMRRENILIYPNNLIYFLDLAIVKSIIKSCNDIFELDTTVFEYMEEPTKLFTYINDIEESDIFAKLSNNRYNRTTVYALLPDIIDVSKLEYKDIEISPMIEGIYAISFGKYTDGIDIVASSVFEESYIQWIIDTYGISSIVRVVKEPSELTSYTNIFIGDINIVNDKWLEELRDSKTALNVSSMRCNLIDDGIGILKPRLDIPYEDVLEKYIINFIDVYTGLEPIYG